MRFHMFGDPENPVMLLLHGVLTPWQIWNEQISVFSKEYYVAAAALDGHEEETASEFVSLDDEAQKIEKFCLAHFGRDIAAVCGLSMGGAIAYRLWCRKQLRIGHLILDGAPLIPSGMLLRQIMTANYLSIIRKSQKRDPGTLKAFRKNFLPEKYLASYLKIADHMSDSTVQNMLSSVCSSRLEDTSPDSATRVLFLHGTKGNELLAKRSADKLTGIHPGMTIHCFEGDPHCHKAIYETGAWLRIVQDFLKKQA